jgi:filamentous hemagglutinin family protein
MLSHKRTSKISFGLAVLGSSLPTAAYAMASPVNLSAVDQSVLNEVEAVSNDEEATAEVELTDAVSPIIPEASLEPTFSTIEEQAQTVFPSSDESSNSSSDDPLAITMPNNVESQVKPIFLETSQPIAPQNSTSVITQTTNTSWRNDINRVSSLPPEEISHRHSTVNSLVTTVHHAGNEDEVILAQVVPDDTLGVEASVVTPEVLINGNLANQIDGGARRGTNLFHSFEEFSIDTGQRVYFTNPDGVENILTRVTGENMSNIDGLLGVEGPANLFLVNPSGILFGSNAVLDISGSFSARTTSGISFADGSEFNAINPESVSLLTVSVPLGVQVDDSSQGDILNEGNLTVGNGQTLSLFGDTTISRGSLSATGGRVEVLGNQIVLDEQAYIDVSGETEGGTVLIGGDYQGQGVIPRALHTTVREGARVSADGLNNGDGGQIIIWADDTTTLLGNLSAQGGLESGNGGFIEVSGQDALRLGDNWVEQINVSAPEGTNGILLLDPNDIIILPGTFSVIGSSPTNDTILGSSDISNFLNTIGSLIIETSGAGGTGDIVLQGSQILWTTGNSLTLNADANMRLENGSSIISRNGGSININTGSLNLTDGARLIANTSNLENSGKINIVARNNIQMDGQGTSIVSGVATNASGTRGGIDITAGSLKIRNGADVGTATDAQSDAGLLRINVDGDLTIEGRGSLLASFVATNAIGNSQGISIQANTVNILNGASLTTDTFGEGNAGLIRINANEEITISGSDSYIQSDVNVGSMGNSNGLDLSANNINILDGAVIKANTNGYGDSGIINITATDSVIVRGNGSFIESSIGSNGIGDNGGINIHANTLQVSDGAIVSTSTFGQGNAGSLSISTDEGTVRLDSAARIFSTINNQVSLPNGEKRISGGIEINTGSLIVSNGSVVSSSTNGFGNAGLVNINASREVEVVGQNSSIESEVKENADGDSDGINIQAYSLQVLDAATISANTLGRGNSGTINVRISEDVNVINDPMSSTISRIVTAVGNTAVGNGGDLNITANSLEISGRGSIATSTSGRGNSGTVTIRTNERVTVQGNGSKNSSGILSAVGQSGIGNGGDIEIYTRSLQINNGAVVSASSLGLGNAGLLSIHNNGGIIEVNNAASISSEIDNQVSLPNGERRNSGGIEINTGSLTVANSSVISASTMGRGNAGPININASGTVIARGQNSFIESKVRENANGDSGGIEISTGTLTILDGAEVNADTQGEGSSGQVIINAREGITISGSNSQITTGVDTNAVGDSGGIVINTRDLSIFDNSAVNTNTLGRGDSGLLSITATGNILIKGDGSLITSAVAHTAIGDSGGIEIRGARLDILEGSGVGTQTLGRGSAGSVLIITDTINLDEGEIASETFVPQSAGNISIQPNVSNDLSIELSGNSQISSSTSGTGVGANLFINAPGTIVIRGNGRLSAGSQISEIGNILGVVESEIGRAGNLNLTANSVILDNGVVLETNATSLAGGGNINFFVGDILLLRRGSSINAAASNVEGGNGGNINIYAGFVVAVPGENSDIIANAISGDGGRIDISAQQTLGFTRQNESDLIFVPAVSGLVSEAFWKEYSKMR